jgi:hypothetical protein
MRTTVDVPDALFKRAKLRAVHEGVSLRDLFVRALTREISPQSVSARAERAAALFAALDASRNAVPVGRLNRGDLYDRPVLR